MSRDIVPATLKPMPPTPKIIVETILATGINHTEAQIVYSAGAANSDASTSAGNTPVDPPS